MRRERQETIARLHSAEGHPPAVVNEDGGGGHALRSGRKLLELGAKTDRIERDGQDWKGALKWKLTLALCY